MRFVPVAAAVLALCAAPASVQAQDLIPDVEYFTGKEGMEEKEKGVLMVSAEGIRFTKKDGTVLITIPIGTIVQVERSTDIRDASVGKKLLFGSLAGSRKQEFLTISTETSSTAEAIIFKLKQNTGAAAVAKINFHRKQAGAIIAPAGADSAARPTNPAPPR